jgi:SAV_6107-like HEPN
MPWTRSRPGPASEELLRLSARGLADATVATTAGERYAAAHLAALRAAASVLAARAQPALVRRRPSSVWVLLPAVAPELGEWSAFFAAGAAKRAAAEAGLQRAVTPREADDLVRDASTFLALVETTLGYTHQPALEVGAYPLTG